jgi:hypothetical protein
VDVSTIDELRERLRAALGTVVVPDSEAECPTCRGTGKVIRQRRTVTQADVAEAIGTTRTGVTTFLAGRQGFTMPVTLALLDWLDAAETKTPDPSLVPVEKET